MRSEHELRDRQEILLDALDEDDDPITRAKLEAVDFILGDGDSIVEDEFEIPETNADLDALINRLYEDKNSVPEYSMFGDPNWRAYDAQIEICKWAKGS